jgi:hypothetical protein
MENEQINKIVTRRTMTPDEYSEYLDKTFPERPICCFCKRKVDCPYGNSPRPIGKRGRCCGECNQAVMLVRMEVLTIPYATKHKKELGLIFYLWFQKTQKEQQEA